MFFISILEIQSQTNKDTIITRDLTLEKEYKPFVDSQKRISEYPQPESLNIEKRSVEYLLKQNTSVRGDLNYEPFDAAIIQSNREKEKKAYIRLGGGTNLSILNDIQLNLLRRPTSSFSINFLNRSIFGDVENYAGENERAYSCGNNLSLDYKKNFSSSFLSLSLGGNVNFWNYYGSYSDLEFYEDIDNQWSFDSKLNLEYKSKNKGQFVLYDFDLEMGKFRLGKNFDTSSDDAKGASETRTMLTGILSFGEFSKSLPFFIEASAQMFNYSAPEGNLVDQYTHDDVDFSKDYFSQQNYFELHPYFKYQYSDMVLNGGVKLCIPTLSSEKVLAALTFGFDYSFSDNFSAGIQIDGGIKNHSYKDGFIINPWINPSLNIRSTRMPFKFMINADYKIADVFTMKPFISYSVLKNDYFFYNRGYQSEISSTAGRIFDVLYSDNNQISLGSTFLFQLYNKFSLNLDVKYNAYNLNSDDVVMDNIFDSNKGKALERPKFESKLRCDYNIIGDIHLFIQHLYQGGRYSLSNTSLYKMKNLSNLSCGLNYKFTDRTDIFFNLENIFNKDYEIYSGYKVHGVNAMVGASVSF